MGLTLIKKATSPPPKKNNQKRKHKGIMRKKCTLGLLDKH